MIRDNILRIKDEISSVCRTLGKNPQDITLIAVTKFATPPMIEEALHGGITQIAENKVQEAVKKFPGLNTGGLAVTKHMIGHMQKNKVKLALQTFDVIQSVDSLELAKTIDQQAANLGKKAEILVQVNTSGEPQKFGISPRDALSLILKISVMENIRISGLMTIAPDTRDEEMIRRSFRDLKAISDEAKQTGSAWKNIAMKYLSMGMSSDFKIALEEGANMIRIGRAIFKDS